MYIIILFESSTFWKYQPFPPCVLDHVNLFFQKVKVLWYMYIQSFWRRRCRWCSHHNLLEKITKSVWSDDTPSYIICTNNHCTSTSYCQTEMWPWPLCGGNYHGQIVKMAAGGWRGISVCFFFWDKIATSMNNLIWMYQYRCFRQTYLLDNALN